MSIAQVSENSEKTAAARPPFVSENDGGRVAGLHEDRPAGVPLGITTEFVSASVGDDLGLSGRDDNRQHAYDLQEVAASLLPGERVAGCMQFVIPDKDLILRYNDETGRASGHNVARCGSVWTCPVCAQHINLERGRELQEAIDHSNLFMGSQVLITLTARHNAGDDLGDLMETMEDAWRGTQSGRQWMRFKADYGIIGTVKAWEVLDGDNGWHPHYHIIAFSMQQLTPQDITAMGEFISDRWNDQVERAGGYASVRYGADVRSGESAARYVTKWAREDGWDLSKELTAKSSKSSQGVSPFQLLDEHISGGDGRAGHRFVEYATATKGRHSIRWSPGLRDRLLVGYDEDDYNEIKDKIDELREDAAEVLLESLRREETVSREVIRLTNEQGAHLLRHRLLARLLQVVEITKGDSERVWAWCVDVAGIPSSGAGPGMEDERRKADIAALQAALRERMAHRFGEDCAGD